MLNAKPGPEQVKFQDKSSRGVTDRPLTNRFSRAGIKDRTVTNLLSWKMACPFLPEPVNVGAQIVRGALRLERFFRDRSNPLD